MYYTARDWSPVGPLLLAGREDGLIGLWLEGQKYFGAGLPEQREQREDLPILRSAKEWLDRYFAGDRPAIAELALAPAGSPFRQGVWRILCEIPYGQVTTYAAIAKQMAERMQRKTMSAQAVGGAVGHNPISIIIPCHRVVGTNGSLTGYAGGVDKKRRLLEWEGADLSRLSAPAGEAAR